MKLEAWLMNSWTVQLQACGFSSLTFAQHGTLVHCELPLLCVRRSGFLYSSDEVFDKVVAAVEEVIMVSLIGRQRQGPVVVAAMRPY